MLILKCRDTNSVSGINRPRISVILVSLMVNLKNTFVVVKLFYMFYNLFQALTHVSEACYPLLDGCRKNRQKWQSLAEQQEKNMINGESNQAKRNWDADFKTTSLSSRRRHSNRGVLHFTKHCMDLDYVLPLLYYFSTFQDIAWPCICKGYIKIIYFFYDIWVRSKKICKVSLCYPIPQEGTSAVTRLSLRAYYFIDVYSCSVIMLWPVS